MEFIQLIKEKNRERTASFQEKFTNILISANISHV